MAAKILAVYNQKGGVGKSMVSMQLSAAIADRGYRVLVVDMDKQGTALVWSSQASPELPFPATLISLAVNPPALITELEKFSSDYDVIIIDCPPSVSSNAEWFALLCSAVGLLPVTPALDNIWAIREAIKIGLDAQEERAKKGLVLNLAMVINNYRRGKVQDLCIDEIMKISDVQPLPVWIRQRNVYPESQAFGCSVFQLGARAKEAVAEVSELATHVLKLMDLPPHATRKKGKK